MNLVVYTAALGNTDPLMPQRFRRGARFVAFTDRPTKIPGWEIEMLPPQERPTRASRCLKILSHLVFPDADATLWLDAAFTMRFPVQAILAENTGDWVTHRHNTRTRMSQEAEEVIRLGKAKEGAVREQVAKYHADGYDTEDNPDHSLTANGATLRRHTPEVRALNEAWWAEVNRHTLRDQLSLQYCAWKQKFSISNFKGRRDRYFVFRPYERPVNDF